MELSKEQIKRTKGVAIIFMIILHLFCRKDIQGYYDTSLFINNVPFIYYIALLGGACVPIYCFASGYDLYIGYKKKYLDYYKYYNRIRILKFLINFWIVLILTCIAGYLLGMKEIYPGSVSNLLGNILLIKSTYCGAWWFVQTYVILVVLSPIIFKLIDKYDSRIVVFLSMVIYFIAYLQRIKNVIPISNEVISLIINAIVLFGTSQLSFVIGAVFVKEGIYSKISSAIFNIKGKNLICIIGIIGLVVVHGFIETMFIDPFIAVIFICLFNLMNLDSLSKKIWNFFGTHSTNMWLTHMLFYMNFAEEFVFASRNVVVIFLVLVGLSIISSYLINMIYKPIIREINNKLYATNINYLRENA